VVVAASGNDSSLGLRIPYNGLKRCGEIQGMTGCTVFAKTQDVWRDACFFNQYACQSDSARAQLLVTRLPVAPGGSLRPRGTIETTPGSPF
jgi:hypothetical protein